MANSFTSAPQSLPPNTLASKEVKTEPATITVPKSPQSLGPGDSSKHDSRVALLVVSENKPITKAHTHAEKGFESDASCNFLDTTNHADAPCTLTLIDAPERTSSKTSKEGRTASPTVGSGSNSIDHACTSLTGDSSGDDHPEKKPSITDQSTTEDAPATSDGAESLPRRKDFRCTWCAKKFSSPEPMRQHAMECTVNPGRASLARSLPSLYLNFDSRTSGMVPFYMRYV